MKYFLFSLFLFIIGFVYPQNCLEFDGSNDLVHIDDHNDLDLTTNGTIEAWVYLTQYEDYSAIVHKGDQGDFSDEAYSLQMAGSFFGEPNSKILLAILETNSNYEYLVSNTELELNRWYHIVGTWNSTTLNIYVNGVLDASKSHSINLRTTNGGINIATQNSMDANKYNFHGFIDEVRIWSSTLSHAQIQNNMFSELSSPSLQTDLQLYMKFNESSGLITDNAEGNSDKDGSLENMNGNEWTSVASPIRIESEFTEGNLDITNNSNLWVDIEMSNEASNNTYGIFQINQYPTGGGLESFVAQNHWELWAADIDFDGNFSATIKFYYDNIIDIENESKIKLFRKNNRLSSTWSEVTSAVVNDLGDDTDGNGYVELTIDHTTIGYFSGQYVISGDDVDDETYPIELISFDAYPQNQKIIIEWSTASEFNCKEYLIEKSFDLSDFQTIGYVSASGFSNSLKTYKYEDSKLSNSTVYYRLTQIDFDGKSETFDPVAVDFSSQLDFSVYPNPNNGVFFIQLNESSNINL